MARVQLALNVSDLEAAIGFYTKLLGVGPAKVEDGYANYAVADPPLKLVLVGAGEGTPVRLNHLGIEVDTPDEVRGATARLAAEGLATEVEEATTCCYATQDKVWVADPDGAPWEVYTVLADAEVFGRPAELGSIAVDSCGAGACCA